MTRKKYKLTNLINFHVSSSYCPLHRPHPAVSQPSIPGIQLEAIQGQAQRLLLTRQSSLDGGGPSRPHPGPLDGGGPPRAHAGPLDGGVPTRANLGPLEHPLELSSRPHGHQRLGRT